MANANDILSDSTRALIAQERFRQNLRWSELTSDLARAYKELRVAEIRRLRTELADCDRRLKVLAAGRLP